MFEKTYTKTYTEICHKNAPGNFQDAWAIFMTYS